MVKLAAPPSFRLLDLGAIADDVVVTTGDDRRMTQVYFDTPDLRLVRWGATLRKREHEGWSVRLPSPDGKTSGDHRFAGVGEDPPEEALDMLRAFIRSARLVPVARLRTVRHVVVLRSQRGRRLAEIDDDEITVLDGRRVAARFREVEVTVDPGHSQLLDGILHRLDVAGAGVADPTPKLVHALGSRALEPPEIVVDDIDKNAEGAAVVRRAIAASVVRLLRHDAIVRDAGDPEGVHQARVSTRRLRSDLRTFAPLLDTAWSEPLRAELSWLAGELGAVRDADVLLGRLHDSMHALHVDDAEHGEALLHSLHEHVAARREHLLRSLHSARYIALLDRLVEAANRPAVSELAAQRASETVPQLAIGPYLKLRKAVRRLPSRPADEQLHAIRIAAKRSRYAAEAVIPVVGRRAEALARGAAALQEILGEFHDAIVAQDWLREHGSTGEMAFVAGQLHAREWAVAESARSSWEGAWKKMRKAEPDTWT